MKLMSLPEAFRVILRHYYPQWPDLAGEIKSRLWFHYVVDTPAEHVTAAKFAVNLIRSAIIDGRLRLKGFLNGDPQDIDAMRIIQGELDVHRGTLDIKNGFHTTRSYSNIHCHEDEIRPLLREPSAGQATGRSHAEVEHVQVPDAPRHRYLTEKNVDEFVANYIASDPNPTSDGLDQFAQENGYIGGRDLYRPEYRRQMKPQLGQIRRGRRRKIREN